jgi:DNA-binding CsgD family transcriptional regulator
LTSRNAGAVLEPNDTPYRQLHRGRPLSPRQREVLTLVAKGEGNVQIAHDLGISEQTAKNHMSSILAKLGVTDRAAAAVLFVTGGTDSTAIEHAIVLFDTAERLLAGLSDDVAAALEDVRKARAEAESRRRYD